MSAALNSGRSSQPDCYTIRNGIGKAVEIAWRVIGHE